MSVVHHVGHFVSFGIGGNDKNSLSIIRGQVEAGCKVKMFYNEWSIPKPVAGNHSADYVPVSRQSQFAELGQLIKIDSVADFAKHNIQILHTHRSGEDNWLLPNFESTPFPFRVIETNFHGSRYTKADVRCYPSLSLMNARGIKEDAHNRIVPNAIDKPRSTEDLRDELGLQNKFVYGRIARADRDIYCNLNLRAYAQIETEDTVFLYVAPFEQARVDAAALGIKNIIWLPPELDLIRLSKIYNTFDIVCHSNGIGETFGNTIAEAMMHGKPVISHDAGTTWPQAHKDLFGARHDLFRGPNDVEGYARVMGQMRDQAFRNEAAKYLKDGAELYYGYKQVAQQYLGIYEMMLAKII